MKNETCHKCLGLIENGQEFTYHFTSYGDKVYSHARRTDCELVSLFQGIKWGDQFKQDCSFCGRALIYRGPNSVKVRSKYPLNFVHQECWDSYRIVTPKPKSFTAPVGE